MNTTLTVEKINGRWYLVKTTIIDGEIDVQISACETQDVRAGC